MPGYKAKLRVKARNLSQLFERVALDLTEMLTRGELQEGKASKKRIIRVKAVDDKSLLYEWVNQILKLADEQGLVVREVRMQEMTEIDLAAELKLAEVRISVSIPGSLSSDLVIKEKQGAFEARLIFE